jgi:hypothetical protein
MIKKEDLQKYGKVEQYEEVNGMLYIKITDGYSEKMHNWNAIMKDITEAVGDKYSVLHKHKSERNLFELVLKSK